jgi:hypothetical protein
MTQVSDGNLNGSLCSTCKDYHSYAIPKAVPNLHPSRMVFNAEDNWEFPAAVVVAAEEAVEIGPNHAAPAKANPGAILQAAVFQHEIRALGALLQPPGIAAAAALPAPQGNPQVPRPGQASLPTFSDCERMGGFSLGKLIPSVVKLIIGMTSAPDASCCWP